MCTGVCTVQVYCTGVCVQVTLYTEQGWQEDLPRLLSGREGHGCGHFRNEDGVLVNMIMKVAQHTLYIYRQVYLVTGGYYEDTTEMLEEGAGGWTLTSPLPRQSYGIRVVSIDNRVLATGPIHLG